MNQASGLVSGEQVKYTGKLHWAIFAPAIVLLTIGEILMLSEPGGNLPGKILLSVGALLLFRAMMTTATTEILITTQRLIIKYGIISLQTFTSPLNKIEAVQVRRGLFGMFLGYGTITVSGTGKSSATIHHLNQPESFQAAIHEQEA